MRIEWLNKNNTDRVVVFFNGWGMDAQVVRHLKADCDVLVCYDYRELRESFPDIRKYKEIYVIAWSMGVWAAAQVLPPLNYPVKKYIALNGTERPVDDCFGIPVKVYELTEKGMNERGREKFFMRMLDTPEEKECFNAARPLRRLEEQCEELCKIHKQSLEAQQILPWNKVYISEKDVIFPVENQCNWWTQRGMAIDLLPGNHYPFCHFSSWREIYDK